MYIQVKKSSLKYPNSCCEDKLDKYLWNFIIIFTLIGGLRWNVGADSYAYASAFKHPERTLDLFWENKEYLWYALLWFHKSLNLHYVFGMSVAAFLQIYFLTKSTSNYRHLLLFLPVVLFGSHYFHDMMNGVRQMIAASVFFYATREITYRRPLRYVLLILFASFFHRSALTLLPLYFIIYIDSLCIKLIKCKWLCLFIFISCIIIGLTPQFQGLMKPFEDVANLTGYEGYVTQLDDQMSGEGEMGKFNILGVMQMSYIITAIFTILYSQKILNKYSRYIPHLGLWLFLSFAYVCLQYMTQNLGISLLRPVMYLEYFHMFITALLLYYFYNYHKVNMKYTFWILFVVIWVSACWNVIKATPYFPAESIIYKLYIFHNIR